jgi:hypothetical protein
MNADQIAEIRPALCEAIDGAPDTCVTFEVQRTPTKWVQLADNTINASYPHNDHPRERVKNFPSAHLLTKITDWEAGKFATFEFSEIKATAIANWIDAYFVNVLSCASGDYHLDVTSEQL